MTYFVRHHRFVCGLNLSLSLSFSLACLLVWPAYGFAQDTPAPPPKADLAVFGPVGDEQADAVQDDTAQTTDATDLADAPPLCFDPTPAVISLGYPSRYTADSKTRSDFDSKNNAAVDAALGPIDDFVNQLATTSNRALIAFGGDPASADAKLGADCVIEHIYQWAKLDALSRLETEGARMSVASRVGGIAFAYATAAPMATQDDRMAVIRDWLHARATTTMAYFDTEAPDRTSRNNLRAWAALSVARIGLTLQDDGMLDWADASVRLVACDANPDGSLPTEMSRGPLALHYQIHAIGPLVITAALLQPRGAMLFDACDRAIPRAAGFIVAAIDDPKLVEAHAAAVQKFDAAPEKLRAFEYAWTTAYLAHVPDLAVQGLVDRIAAQKDAKPFSNSKLGGDQSLFW